jgi:hypothetical protein
MTEARFESTRGVIGGSARLPASTSRLLYVRSTLIGLNADVRGVPPAHIAADLVLRRGSQWHCASGTRCLSPAPDRPADDVAGWPPAW